MFLEEGNFVVIKQWINQKQANRENSTPGQSSPFTLQKAGYLLSRPYLSLAHLIPCTDMTLRSIYEKHCIMSLNPSLHHLVIYAIL